MKFEFATAPRIIVGAGAAAEIPAVAKNLGRRALLVTGENPQRAEKLSKELSAEGVAAKIFHVPGEPEISTIETGVAFARKENCDLVIALGGGSVIDAGKAIAAMPANEGEVLDYLEIIGRGKSISKPGAPFIAVPTTAGTGAEVTRNAVLSSPAHKVKVSLRSPFMLPRVAVVDPELTYDLPPALTASTGLDALTQLIEPYVCTRANPMTDGFCEQGIYRVARSLREAVFNGQNKSAREDMALASLFGGMALANAGLGAVHGFAGPIGGMFPAPHGAVCAVLLPHVMAANLRALRERSEKHPALARFQKITALLTGNREGTADDGVVWVQNLVNELPIPKLGAYGIREEHIADIVTKAANASSMKANPIGLTPEELARTLRLAI
ncbi:MAG TPA: iron-containing alcohol dehydrogenase [Candidatus Sulfotelmatobacter sp.]|jgi:alcohol dehydrogenase class IV|nr:iron-containing alcohol dehydrogenase [Candidatus Sulfotelmatobacter sp.]